jgi:hypothetical protein
MRPWTTRRQPTNIIPPLHTQDQKCISPLPAVILALFEVRDVIKVSRQSESVRLELFSDQHALCLLFLFEDALLASPDGDGYVLMSITPDPTHHGLAPLSDFLPFRFPTPTSIPLITCEDVKSAPRPHPPRSHAGTHSHVPAVPRTTAQHQHKNICMQHMP